MMVSAYSFLNDFRTLIYVSDGGFFIVAPNHLMIGFM